MNIFISANDRYILPTKVMLTSFLVNNSEEYHHIYFMYSSVSEENICALGELVGQYGADFIPVQVNSDSFGEFRRTERISVETYYRFLVTKILPDSESRALWMDVDLVVNGKLDDFYYQDFNGNHLAGCRDIGDHTEKLEKLNCPEGSSYINAGVILFNAEKMRQYDLEDYCSYYTTHEKEITWFDQDVINGMFAGKISVWDCDLFNVQVSNWRFKNQYDLNQAAIIHYIGESKPWFTTYTNAAARVWDFYYAKTFNCSGLYLFKRRIHRWMQKHIWIPFSEYRRKLYAENKAVCAIRDFIRGKRNKGTDI